MTVTGDPDWDKIRELSERAAALVAAGEMTAERYDELFDQAVEASHGHLEVAEALTHYAPREALV